MEFLEYKLVDQCAHISIISWNKYIILEIPRPLSAFNIPKELFTMLPVETLKWIGKIEWIVKYPHFNPALVSSYWLIGHVSKYILKRSTHRILFTFLAVGRLPSVPDVGLIFSYYSSIFIVQCWLFISTKILSYGVYKGIHQIYFDS